MRGYSDRSPTRCPLEIKCHSRIIPLRRRSEVILLERSNVTDYTATSQTLAGRRALFCVLVAATMAAMLWMMGAALSVGGFGLLDALVLICFGLTLPWTVIGFWNAVIGFVIMRFASDPVAAVTPVAAQVRGDEPIVAATAVLVCVRNEGPERVVRNIEPMMAELAASGFADRFHVYVLSDTNRADIAALEEQLFGALAERFRGKIPLTYRRRASNEGFKAGNIRDFC